jgi:hypothetical protein
MGMKKEILFLAILLVFNYSLGFSQCDTANKQKFIIKTDLFYPVLGLINDIYTGSLSLEYCPVKRQSVQLTTVFAKAISGATLDGSKQTRLNEWSLVILPQYKYYLNKKKCQTGLYTGGYLKYIYFFSDTEWQRNNQPYVTDYFKYSVNDLGGGGIFGYQNYCRHFVYDFMLGLGYRKSFHVSVIRNSSFDEGGISYSGFDAIFSANIGYRF